MHFIMMVGCSGSGKSTLVDELRQKNPSVVVISLDTIIDEFAALDGIGRQEAHSHYSDLAQDISIQTATIAFERGLDVVWDGMNLTRRLRAERLDMVPDSYEKIAVTFEASRKALRARIDERNASGGRQVPLAVMERQFMALQAPDYDEGFDRVLIQKVPEPAFVRELEPA